MTNRTSQPRSELPPSMRAHEAKLLAVMLRTSRLTWVFGEPGKDKGALLKTGVMPLLQRRRSDRGAAPSTVVDTFASPERRRPSVRRPARPQFEAAIYFDSWGQAPLSLLKRQINDIVPVDARADTVGGPRLAATLQRLNQQLGLHFVFLLDRFEEYLAMASDEGEVGQFANELVEAILHEELPASFLVSMDEVARPLLERFRARIPGLDHNVLRVSPVAELRDLPPQPGAALARKVPAPQAPEPAEKPSPALTAKTARGPHPRQPPRVLIKVEDVYALIESTLARTKTGQRSGDSRCDVELDLSAVVPAAVPASSAGSVPSGPPCSPEELAPRAGLAATDRPFSSPDPVGETRRNAGKST